MKKNLQNLLLITFLTLGLTSNSQNRYLDEVFSSVKITDSVMYAQNVSIEPMLIGLGPTYADIL